MENLESLCDDNRNFLLNLMKELFRYVTRMDKQIDAVLIKTRIKIEFQAYYKRPGGMQMSTLDVNIWWFTYPCGVPLKVCKAFLCFKASFCIVR